MIGSERASVWYPLQRALKERNWHHQRLEDKLALGVPDVCLHVPNGHDVWVELKFMRQLPSASSKFNLGVRREQYVWLHGAMKAGRKCGVLALISREWCWWGTQQSLKELRTEQSPYCYDKRFDTVDDFLLFLSTRFVCACL